MNDKKRKIKSAIINHLKEGFVFIPHEEAKIRNVYPKQTQEVGLLHKRIRLSSLINECGCDENEILAVLDDMSRRRQIKIFSIEINRSLNSDDISFYAEIGRGIRQPTNHHSMEVVSKIFYWEKGRNLTLKDFHFGGKTIAEPSLEVEKQRDEKEKYFEKRFGKIDFDIEKQLYREKVMADAEIGSAIIRAAKALEKKEKEV